MFRCIYINCLLVDVWFKKKPWYVPTLVNFWKKTFKWLWFKTLNPKSWRSKRWHVVSFLIFIFHFTLSQTSCISHHSLHLGHTNLSLIFEVLSCWHLSCRDSVYSTLWNIHTIFTFIYKWFCFNDHFCEGNAYHWLSFR